MGSVSAMPSAAHANLFELATEVGAALALRRMTLATAESCTGGWIGQAITMVPGSSAWYERGFITYTNIAKVEMLGVHAATLETCGAVSENTVREMAEGALAYSHADMAVAVSGVAGPSGGTPVKPVGMVCIAWAGREAQTSAETFQFPGDRDAVRCATVIAALTGLLQRLPQ